MTDEVYYQQKAAKHIEAIDRTIKRWEDGASFWRQEPVITLLARVYDIQELVKDFPLKDTEVCHRAIRRAREAVAGIREKHPGGLCEE